MAMDTEKHDEYVRSLLSMYDRTDSVWSDAIDMDLPEIAEKCHALCVSINNEFTRHLKKYWKD